MLGCHRPPAPAALDARANDLTESYVRKRQANPRHDFRWPEDLYEIVRAALAQMTDERCAYCDGDLRPAPVRAEIDHFQPKSCSDFHWLVCAWSNLFLVCSPCNGVKGSKWSPDLLKPDDPGYAFHRYFDYDFQRDKLRPNPGASIDDQRRARTTIELLGLNDDRQPASRRRARQAMTRPDYDLRDAQYRYLIPLLPVALPRSK